MIAEPSPVKAGVQTGILYRSACLAFWVGVPLVVGLVYVVLRLTCCGPGSEKIRQTSREVTLLAAALHQHKAITGSYPAQDEGLGVLIQKLDDQHSSPLSQTFKAETDLHDAWGTKYFYRTPGAHNPESFDVFSAGSDGMPDTADDIGNWY